MTIDEATARARAWLDPDVVDDRRTHVETVIAIADLATLLLTVDREARIAELEEAEQVVMQRPFSPTLVMDWLRRRAAALQEGKMIK